MASEGDFMTELRNALVKFHAEPNPSQPETSTARPRVIEPLGKPGTSRRYPSTASSHMKAGYYGNQRNNDSYDNRLSLPVQGDRKVYRSERMVRSAPVSADMSSMNDNPGPNGSARSGWAELQPVSRNAGGSTVVYQSPKVHKATKTVANGDVPNMDAAANDPKHHSISNLGDSDNGNHGNSDLGNHDQDISPLHYVSRFTDGLKSALAQISTGNGTCSQGNRPEPDMTMNSHVHGQNQASDNGKPDTDQGGADSGKSDTKQGTTDVPKPDKAVKDSTVFIKEAREDLYQELNVALQKRKQTRNVNVLDIERMKTGKSIMYFCSRSLADDRVAAPAVSSSPTDLPQGGSTTDSGDVAEYAPVVADPDSKGKNGSPDASNSVMKFVQNLESKVTMPITNTHGSIPDKDSESIQNLSKLRTPGLPDLDKPKVNVLDAKLGLASGRNSSDICDIVTSEIESLRLYNNEQPVRGEGEILYSGKVSRADNADGRPTASDTKTSPRTKSTDHEMSHADNESSNSMGEPSHPSTNQYHGQNIPPNTGSEDESIETVSEDRGDGLVTKTGNRISLELGRFKDNQVDVDASGVNGVGLRARTEHRSRLETLYADLSQCVKPLATPRSTDQTPQIQSESGVSSAAPPPPPPLPPSETSSKTSSLSSAHSSTENLVKTTRTIYSDANTSIVHDDDFQTQIQRMALLLRERRKSSESLANQHQDDGVVPYKDCSKEFQKKLSNFEENSDNNQVETDNSTNVGKSPPSFSRKLQIGAKSRITGYENVYVDGALSDIADNGLTSEGRQSELVSGELTSEGHHSEPVSKGLTAEEHRPVTPKRLPRIQFTDEPDTPVRDPDGNHDDPVIQKTPGSGTYDDSEGLDHPGTLISQLVNTVRSRAETSDVLPSDHSSGLSELPAADIESSSLSLVHCRGDSRDDSRSDSYMRGDSRDDSRLDSRLDSSLPQADSHLFSPQSVHTVNTQTSNLSLATATSYDNSTIITTCGDDVPASYSSLLGDAPGEHRPFMSKSLDQITSAETSISQLPVTSSDPEVSHNRSTDLDDGFATYPPPRQTRNRTSSSGQDRELITSLMITHSGDRIPPEGAENQVNRTSNLLNNPNMTVPEPTSFHQHGNNVGKHFLNGTQVSTVAEVHRSTSLRHIVPPPSAPIQPPDRASVDYDNFEYMLKAGKKHPLPKHVTLDKEAQRYMLYYTWSSQSGARQHKGNHLRRVRHRHDNDSDSSGTQNKLLTETLPEYKSPLRVHHTPPPSKHRTTNGVEQGESGVYYRRRMSAQLLNVDLPPTNTYRQDPRPSRHRGNHGHGSDGDTESLYQDYDEYEESLIRYVKPEDLCEANENIKSLYRQQLEASRLATIMDAPSTLLQRLSCCFICQSQHSSMSALVDPSNDYHGNNNHDKGESYMHQDPEKTKRHKDDMLDRYWQQDDSVSLGTPITQNITDGANVVSAYGGGLQAAMKGQKAAFVIDTKGRRGNLEVHVKGTNTVAQVQLVPVGDKFEAAYVPTESGLFHVTILWNGQQITNSPFQVSVSDPIDLNSIAPLNGWMSILDGEGKMFLKVNAINVIDFDTSRASSGLLTATVESPSNEVIPVTVERAANGLQTTVSFIPRFTGLHKIRVFCNDQLLPRGAIIALASEPVDHEKVVLTGRGLQEATVNQEADFIIDGSDAGRGEPDVKITGIKQDVPVRLVPLGGNKFKVIYIPNIPGAYLLTITWAGRTVRGSPFKVSVKSGANASKVNVNTDSFRASMLGREIKAVIDTRRAGPGELTAHCMGPNLVAYCELEDHRDGTFTLNIRPQEAGKHILQVKYGGEHVPGSPFQLRVAGKPDASKVRVTGPGVEHGILASFQSRFIVETRGAGAGQLTVRIKGPKGAFRVEMQRESQKDRTILCRYDPSEVGDYILQVKWSGDPVPGSPFNIKIFDTNSELQNFLASNPGNQLGRYVDDAQWSEHL